LCLENAALVITNNDQEITKVKDSSETGLIHSPSADVGKPIALPPPGLRPAAH